MPSIRINKIPIGEAPEDIRKAWVGLVLPLADGRRGRMGRWAVFGVLSGPKAFLPQILGMLLGKHQVLDGYAVKAAVALGILADSAPEAADWWRENAPRFFRPNQYFVFDAESCEEVS
jgi:hypothetical protein